MAGVHSSRLWENIVGRSRALWAHFWPQMQAAFPAALDGVSAEEWYRAINRVSPSLIRVEADEVTYNLHIMLRFELEVASERIPARLHLTPLYDPQGLRVKS